MAKESVNWDKYGVIVSVIGILIATGFSVWGLSRPSPGSITNIQNLFQTINNYIGNKDVPASPPPPAAGASVSTVVDTSSSEISSGSATPPITSMASQSSESQIAPVQGPQFVSLRPLAPNSPVELSSSPNVTMGNLGGYLNILMKASSSKLPVRIFTSDFSQTWSLTTDQGAHCEVVRMSVLNDYNRYDDYRNHIQTMPVVSDGAPLIFDVTAICKQTIHAGTNVYVSAQLSVLPGNASAQNSAPEVINFSGGAITVKAPS